jgi:8-oxo-dGTP diphosphatase
MAGSWSDDAGFERAAKPSPASFLTLRQVTGARAPQRQPVAGIARQRFMSKARGRQVPQGWTSAAVPRKPFTVMVRYKPRIAVRALILNEDHLLLVNAYPDARLALWCAPGGGCEAGQSLPENLMREVWEETGLTVAVGPPALINEFHDPETGFHQIDLFFRCTLLEGLLSPDWVDPEGVVTTRRFFSRAELASGAVRFKPDSLPAAAWGKDAAIYDPLEIIVK